MKKLLLSICLFLAIGAYAGRAQAQTQTSPQFGIRGGLNIANFNNTSSDNYSSRTGFMAGIYFSLPISNSPVVIQPELLYTQKGATIDNYNGSNAKAHYKLDYIEVPVLARFNFITDGSITPHVSVGPALGFNVNADLQVDGGNPSGGSDIKGSVKNTEFSVVVGGGLDFGRLDLGVRYDAGLTKIFGSDEAKNGVFSVVAGIDF